MRRHLKWTALLVGLMGAVSVGQGQARELVAYDLSSPYNVFPRSSSIVLVDQDRGIYRQLTFDPLFASDPDFSPDGKQIVYTGSSPSGGFTSNLYSVNVGDGNSPARPPRQLTSDGRSQNASWGANGKIVFMRLNALSNRQPNAGDLVVLDPNNHSETRLTMSGRLEGVPEWSPDAKQIAFLRYDVSDHPSLYTMNADGSGERLLATDALPGKLAWSPSGRQIAYIGNTFNFSNFGSVVQLVGADGTHPSYISGTEGGSDPAWDTTESNLLFVRPTTIYGQTNPTILVQPRYQLNPTAAFPLNYYGGVQGNPTVASIPDSPQLSINNVGQFEGDSGTTALTFTVSLSVQSPTPVTVTYQTPDVTYADTQPYFPATRNSDFVSVGPKTLTFAPGQTSKTITVLVNGDTTTATRQNGGEEGSEAFVVLLSNPQGATLDDDRGLGIIFDDDSDAPAFTIRDTRVVEGNSGSKDALISVSLSNFETLRNGINVQPQFSVDVTTSNGSATSGSDYTPVTTTLSAFGSGSGSTFTVRVRIIGDPTAEADETFFVTLSNPRSDNPGFTPRIVGSKATVTIQNDDAAPNQNPIIVDNLDGPSRVSIVGDWESSLVTPGYYFVNYLNDKNTGKGLKSVKFTPNLPRAGRYAVYGRWTAGANRASNVPFVFTHAGGTSRASVDQRVNGGAFVLLGVFQFNAGTSGSVTIGNAGTSGFVIADAVKFTPLDDNVGLPPLSTRAVAPSNALSTASANAASSSATLSFSRALAAGAQAGFSVAVNGTATAIVGAQIKSNRLTLLLDGGLKAGDKVVVTWPNGTSTLIAR